LVGGLLRRSACPSGTIPHHILLVRAGHPRYACPVRARPELFWLRPEKRPAHAQPASGVWDWIDFLADRGIGRYRVATAVRRLGSLVLPKTGKLCVNRRAVTRSRRQLQGTNSAETHMCAVLLIATKT
jgi:hypothetical protein